MIIKKDLIAMYLKLFKHCPLVTTALMAIFLSVATPARADLLTYNAGGEITGATGFAVNGSVYDVYFDHRSATEIWGPQPSIFNYTYSPTGYDASEASVFNQALVDLFTNENPVVASDDIAGFGSFLEVYTIATVYSANTFQQEWYGYSANLDNRDANPWYAGSSSGQYPNPANARQAYAIWTEAVPEPNSLVLVGFSLAGVVGVRRFFLL